MNVLLTSVGRRSYLVNYFKEALNGNGSVIGANMFDNAAGMVAADISVITPPANHSEYIPYLIEVCRKYEVELLCSLHDLDIYMLSQNQQWLDDAGISHTLPTAEWGRISLDKYECTQLFERNNIAVPKTTVSLQSALEGVRNGEICFPLMVKARAGFGSLGLAKCYNEKELKVAYYNALDQALASGSSQYIPLPEQGMVLIQEAINGIEVCVDVVNDFDGQYRTHFACEVQSMRSGESDWATTLNRKPHEKTAKAISHLTKHKGIWGIDFLEDKGVFRAVDVNPRFTGDYPFHHLAGADIPKALISWASGKNAADSCFSSTPGITSFKELVPKAVMAK